MHLPNSERRPTPSWLILQEVSNSSSEKYQFKKLVVK